MRRMRHLTTDQRNGSSDGKTTVSIWLHTSSRSPTTLLPRAGHSSEKATSRAFFHTQPVRPAIAVGVDLAAAAVAMVSPLVALILWTLSVTFLGVTSDGVQTMSLVARRRSRSSKAEYTA